MAGDPFFTKKRKRPAAKPRPDRAQGRSSAATNGARSGGGGGGGGASATKQRASRRDRDEEIHSGSDDDFAGFNDDDGGSNAGSDAESLESGRDSDASYDDEDAAETPAEKRLRLAKAYLAEIEADLAADEGDVDAADLDRELIAERLAKDQLVHRDRLYLRIADRIDYAAVKVTRAPTRQSACLTTVAYAHATDDVYAGFKNGDVQRWQLYQSGRLRLRKTVRKAHKKAVLCSAVDMDGETLATGSADGGIKVWSCETMAEARHFTQHRDAVNGLAFPSSAKGSRDLYSASSDRTIKCFDTRQLAYIETLFGHQDVVTDISAVAANACVTVGARDRTARLWKVLDESQLVFRGGDAREVHREGSMDCCAQVDKELFLTGSDNGTLALWSTGKKKALSRIQLAHGREPVVNTTAERDPAAVKLAKQAAADARAVAMIVDAPDTPITGAGRSAHEPASSDALKAAARRLFPGVGSPDRPRWVTAVACIPLSDLVLSGSWDGHVSVWQIARDCRSLSKQPVHRIKVGRGCVNAIVVRPNISPRSAHPGADADGESVAAEGNGGKPSKAGAPAQRQQQQADGEKYGWTIVVALGFETRLGRWRTIGGCKNEIVSVHLPAPATTATEAATGGKAVQLANGTAGQD